MKPPPLRSALGLWLAAAALGCTRNEGGPSQALPIHLEDRLDSATVEGAEVDAGTPDPVRWDFGEGAAEWRVLPALVTGATPAEVEAVDGALRLRLTESSLTPDEEFAKLYGGVYVDVEEFDLSQWSHVLIEARSTAPGGRIGLAYNVRQSAGETPDEPFPTVHWGSETDIVPDGEVHVYRTPTRSKRRPIGEAVRQIAIELGASAPAEMELLSVSLLPAGPAYGDGVGVRSVSASAHEDFGPQRRTLYAHAPSRISYPLRVPAGGRLDLALGSADAESRMAVEVEHDGATEVVLEESVPPDDGWRQRSIDLSRWAERDVRLTLAATRTTEEPAVALWASPTVSGTPAAAPLHPNVIFYVIDGASAGFMSLYGYERPTTPNLEKLAAEGVVFENAHSNSTWTMPSTASFMTSLHHSVLGGLRNDSNPVPPDVKTMAEHFHDARFHTGVFTFNPNAGALSGLDRGVDVFRDFGKRGAPLDPVEAISSQILHAQFWQWRDAYPGPYWVHFQTTDVHPPHHPQDPFAGSFAPKERTAALADQMLTLRFPFRHTSASVHEHWQGQLQSHDIDPQEFYRTMQDAHDEAMLHQDARLGELVAELKARGEWENTLLVIGSDHGHPAASYPRFGRGLLDPQPKPWEGALFGEFESRVPLIFFWPGRIEGGRRLDEPVSMIDVLPTILDLARLRRPEIAQGQSLAPLLLQEDGWEERPLVFDEFRVTDDGSLVGNLELVDGRWGWSLEIRTADDEPPPATGRHPAPAGGRWKALSFDEVPRLLTYDLQADPRAIRHVGDPDAERLAESQQRLWRLWEEHRALAAKFEAGEEAELSPDQLDALQALGYAE